ncbi:presequence protease [Candidatus Magnetomoraceae bacterium gMMP-15]
MKKNYDQNNPEITQGESIYGFEVKRIVSLEDIAAVYYELEHSITGARYIHISREDTENTFSVALKTVPSDSTGVAHILEHTALCGSLKYPVRDPFFSMIKRSLKTFMNAFTASDWTMYPFSTQNKKDFYNLMGVYLDAVFFPKLSELSFKQEGYRLEFNENFKSLVYKGVVYNEMKGAMSSANQVMARSLMKALYPKTTYGYNSGGDPEVIPTLSYEQFKAFHKIHYHPSNAFFYTYGNLSLNEHLLYIQENVLKDFERINPNTDVPHEPRWNQPKTPVYYYPLAESENPEKKAQICLAWLGPGVDESFEILSIILLESILLGNSASPLRKALIESGLGTSLSDGTGFDSELRDTMFACGLKDVKEKDGPEIEKIILGVLTELCEKGIDKQLIDSALHQMEFHHKEVTNSPYPFGLKLVVRSAGSWLHGGDPVKNLSYEELDHLREKVSQGNFLEKQIKKYFLENKHRILFTLLPDQKMQNREDKRVKQELAGIYEKLIETDKTKIKADAEALKHLQEKEEDISCLPSLMINDIPPLVKIVSENDQIVNTSIYEQPTGGIFYFVSNSEVTLPEDLIPFVPFFCYAFSRVGTKDRDYVEMARLMDLYSGGIGLGVNAHTSYDASGKCIPFITFGAKCLNRNQQKLFDIIQELMCRFDFSNLERIKNLLLEYKSGFESQIVNSGHQFAISLSSRGFMPSRELNEIWHGIHQLKTLKNLASDLSDKSLGALSEKLKLIASGVLTKNNLTMAAIGEESTLNTVPKLVENLTDQMPDQPDKTLFSETLPVFFDKKMVREGWTTSSAVSFVAQTFKTVRRDHPDAPILSVISKLLKSLFLHKEIREKGGAYGSFAISNVEDGLFHMASYRDPHIVNTLNVYDRASDFICSGNYTDEDIKEAILQICSEIDKPDSSGHEAQKAFFRKLVSLSDESRLAFKKQILNITKDQVIDTAGRYFGKTQKVSTVIVSSEEKLREANKKLGNNACKILNI